MFNKLRWGASRKTSIIYSRGIGLSFEYGSIGSTYNEEGIDMLLTINVSIGYHYSIFFRWKRV